MTLTSCIDFSSFRACLRTTPMPSHALTSFITRLGEIDQLLSAHDALLRFHRAQTAALTPGLASVATAVNHLVASPGPGRPPPIQALNKAGIALLSGHLQGFLTDLHSEAAGHLFAGHVASIPTMVAAAPTRGNPNRENISRLFATVGFNDILHGISWQRCSNSTLYSRLEAFNRLRNRIVHGSSVSVSKSTVKGYLSSWTALANRLDAKLRNEIRTITGHHPW
jgi:hypothetical protein